MRSASVSFDVTVRVSIRMEWPVGAIEARIVAVAIDGGGVASASVAEIERNVDLVDLLVATPPRYVLALFNFPAEPQIVTFPGHHPLAPIRILETGKGVEIAVDAKLEMTPWSYGLLASGSR